MEVDDSFQEKFNWSGLPNDIQNEIFRYLDAVSAQLKEIAEHDNGSDWVKLVVWSPDRKLLAVGSEGGIVNAWDRDGKIVAKYDYGERLNSIAWSPEGSLLASAGQSSKVKISKPVISFRPHQIKIKNNKEDVLEKRVGQLKLYLVMQEIAQAIKAKKRQIKLGPERYAYYRLLDKEEFMGTIEKKIRVKAEGKKNLDCSVI